MAEFRRFKTYIAYLLLLTVLLLQYNNTVNIHVHHLTDGEIIIHAHPFQKSDKGVPVKHNHTHKQLDLLHYVYHLLVLLLPFFVFGISLNFILSIPAYDFIYLNKIFGLDFHGRSPPVYL